MLNGDLSEIHIVYLINKEMHLLEKEDAINIFGKEFVKNNKNICSMIIDYKEYELSERFNFKNYNKNTLEIVLKGIDNITDMSLCFIDVHHYYISLIILF